MKQVILLTHSTMAQGTKETIELLLGKQVNLHALSAYVGNEDIEEMLSARLNKHKESQIIIFTDMFGSSVNTLATKYANGENVIVVSGYNLPLVLEVLLKDENLSLSDMNDCICEAVNGIKLVNLEIEKEVEETEFF